MITNLTTAILMTTNWSINEWRFLIWLAGGIHIAIILANIPLPRKLQVKRNLAGVPIFIRQVFYVHWLYIVLTVGLFAVLCFAFARDLAGATPMGRFLSAFVAAFWLLRLVLQRFFYDPQLRREIPWMDAAYQLALVMLIGIFTVAAAHPMH